jgi:16S rRNA (guanine527-N7)-methyltransferase
MTAGGEERGVISRETRARLDAFVALLRRWNAAVSLLSTRDREPGRIWSRHIVDSLQLAPLIPAAAKTAIDLGSGAGLPGLVLAIATGLHFALVEADQRKAAFLREAVRLTGAPATVHATRIESLTLPPADLLTARALAPLPTLLTWARPLLAPGGLCLFPKGRDTEGELTAAAAGWHMQLRRVASRTDPTATILCISDFGPAPTRP